MKAWKETDFVGEKADCITKMVLFTKENLNKIFVMEEDQYIWVEYQFTRDCGQWINYMDKVILNPWDLWQTLVHQYFTRHHIVEIFPKINYME